MQRHVSTGKRRVPASLPGCWFLMAGVVYYFGKLKRNAVRRGWSWIR